MTKISVEFGVRSASVKPSHPALAKFAIMRRQIDEPAACADMESAHMLADRIDGVGHLVIGALLQLVEEAVAHRRGIEPGRAEMVEEDVAFLERQQLALPGVGDRAFLGQQRTGAELKGDRTDLGIVDPVAHSRRYQTPPAMKIGVCRGRTRASGAQLADARVGGLPAAPGLRCWRARYGRRRARGPHRRRRRATR